MPTHFALLPGISSIQAEEAVNSLLKFVEDDALEDRLNHPVLRL